MAKPRKRKGGAAPGEKRAIPKRTKDHRTAQDPFEASRPDEEYEVDAILHKVRLCVLRLHLTNLLCRGSSKGTPSTRSAGKTILLRSPTPVVLAPC